MTNNQQNLLSGKEKELKVEFLKIVDSLPDNWINLYVDRFCLNIRGMALINKYNRLQSIRKLKSTPEPSEMKNMLKIIEVEKAKALEL